MQTSTRENGVGVVHGMDDVHRTQLRRLQLDRIDVELDLPVLSSVGLRNGSAGYVGQLIAHIELSQVM